MGWDMERRGRIGRWYGSRKWRQGLDKAGTRWSTSTAHWQAIAMLALPLPQDRRGTGHGIGACSYTGGERDIVTRGNF